MADAGKVTASLQLDTKGFQFDSKGMESSFASAGASGTKFAGILAAGMATVGVAVAAAAVKTIGAANEINKAMANVASLEPQVNSIESLKGAVQSLAVDVGKSTGDLADGLYQVISAFGDTSETTKVLEINAKAAAAGLASTTDAINLTSAVTKGYGDTSAAAVQKVADLAFQTVKLGQTDFPSLATSIGKVVPQFAALKISQEELFGAMATLTGVTGSAAEVSTQLKAVITAMLKPNKDMAEALGDTAEALGDTAIASGSALLESRGLSGALEILQTAAGGSTDKLARMLGSSESLTAVLALTGGQADAFAEKTAAMGEAAGASGRAFSAQTEGVNAAGFAWEQAKVQMGVLAETVGQKLIPMFAGAVTSLKDVLTWVEGLVSGLEESNPAFEAMKTAATGVWDILSSLVEVVIAVLSPFETLFSLFVGAQMETLKGFGTALSTIADVISTWVVPMITMVAEKVGQLISIVVDGVVALLDMAEKLPLVGSQYQGLSDTISNFRLGLKGQGEDLSAAGRKFDEYGKAIEDAEEKLKSFGEMRDEVNKAEKEAAQAGTTLQESEAASAFALLDSIAKLKKELAAKNIVVKEGNKTLKEYHAALEEANKATKDGVNTTEDYGDELEDANKKLRKFDEQELKHKTALLDSAEAMEDARDELKAFNQAWEDGTMAEEAQKLREKIDNIYFATQDVTDIVVPAFMQTIPTAMEATGGKVADLNSALATLGISSGTHLGLVVENANRARDAVLGSNESSDFEKQTAIYKALKAQVAAAESAGTSIPGLQTSVRNAVQAGLTGENAVLAAINAQIAAAEAAESGIPASQVQMLRNIKAKLEATGTGAKASIADPIENAMQAVSTAITDAVDGAVDILLSGDPGSIKAAAKELGIGIAKEFTETALQGVKDFVKDAVLALLKDGKGGFFDAFKGIGDALSNIFGGGGGAGGGGGSTIDLGGYYDWIGGGGSGGAGGGSGGGGSGGGIFGGGPDQATTIGNWFKMGWDIGNDIKQRATEASVERILAETNIATIGILWGQNQWLPYLSEINLAMYRLLGSEGLLGEINEALKRVSESLVRAVAKLGDLSVTVVIGGAGDKTFKGTIGDDRIIPDKIIDKVIGKYRANFPRLPRESVDPGRGVVHSTGRTAAATAGAYVTQPSRRLSEPVEGTRAAAAALSEPMEEMGRRMSEYFGRAQEAHSSVVVEVGRTISTPIGRMAEATATINTNIPTGFGNVVNTISQGDTRHIAAVMSLKGAVDTGNTELARLPGAIDNLSAAIKNLKVEVNLTGAGAEDLRLEGLPA